MMGIDLTLMINDKASDCYSMIRLMRRQKLFEEIERARHGEVIPEMVFAHVGEDGAFALAENDRYGLPLRWVPASELLRYTDHPGVKENWRNRAAWAYLAAIPPETKILLHFS